MWPFLLLVATSKSQYFSIYLVNIHLKTKLIFEVISVLENTIMT